jgi:alpha-beta hydrolase superfamily lysophospholipase
MTALQEAVEVTARRITTADGRGIVVWRTGPECPAPGRVALVAPGFARRMRHLAAAARYLVDNGFVVYRCDYLDHIGLSDGEIRDFTLSGMYSTLDAVLAHVRAAERVDGAVLVAASLAARPSFRLAASTGAVRGIIGLVGVVNPRFTLARAFGADHGARAPDDFDADEYIKFENKKIHCRTFAEDWHSGGWLAAEDTVRDLARVRCPVVNFCGSADDWVSVAEVKEVFAEAGGPARVVELPFVEHELSRNPVAGQTMLREITRCALEFGTGADPAAIEVAEPGFTELVSQIPYERTLEKSTMDRSAGR